MPVSDLTITSFVRMVLVRHRLDLQAVNLRSTRGTVRVSGKLVPLRPDEALTPSRVEAIEADARRVRGVEKIYLDVADWHKNDDGAWEQETSARVEYDEKTRKDRD